MKMNESLMARLQTQYLAIENILSSVDASRFLVRPRPDKWNIHDNIAHLSRYQQVFIQRINQVLVSEEPSFGRYVAEEDAEFENWRALEIDTLLKKMHADRKSLVDMVSSLTDIQLKRIGSHKRFGPLDIVQWTEFFLLHESHHIFTIFQLAYDTTLNRPHE